MARLKKDTRAVVADRSITTGRNRKYHKDSVEEAAGQPRSPPYRVVDHAIRAVAAITYEMRCLNVCGVFSAIDGTKWRRNSSIGGGEEIRQRGRWRSVERNIFFFIYFLPNVSRDRENKYRLFRRIRLRKSVLDVEISPRTVAGFAYPLNPPCRHGTSKGTENIPSVSCFV